MKRFRFRTVVIAGNPAVLAAEHQLQQSKQAVTDAQRNLANTEKAGAQAIAKAEQSLADAIRSASWQRVADAQNVIGFDPFVRFADYIETRAGLVPAGLAGAR